MRSADGKRRDGGRKTKSEGMKRGRGRECEECTQTQGTPTHYHGNRALNFNPSCFRYHGHVLIRALPPPPPHTSHPLAFYWGTWPRAPEKAVIIRLSKASAGSSLPWRQHLHSVFWNMLTPDSILSPWLPIRVCLAVMLEMANFNALLDVSNKQPHAPTIDAKRSNMYDAVLLKKSSSTFGSNT